MSRYCRRPEIARLSKDFLVELRGFEPMCIAAQIPLTSQRGVDG